MHTLAARLWIALAVAAFVGLLCGSAAGQTTITLRPMATIGSPESGRSEPLTLADIADLAGPDAERLGRVELGSAMHGKASESTIRLEEVREALDALSPRVNWGRVTLSGSVCVVRRALPSDAQAASRSGRSAIEPRGIPTPQPIDAILSTGTVRAAVVTRLLDLYDVAPQDLRLAFDPADDALLDLPLRTPEGNPVRRVDVQPGGGATAGRVPVGVLVYDGDRVAHSASIVIQAQAHRDVVIARQPIARSQAITPDMVQISRQWLSPSAKSPLGMDEVVGGIAQTRLTAGAVLVAGDVAAPIACKRGDIVYVHVLSGGITVKAKARALNQARDGELVQLRLDGSKDAFTARMSGRGRAVMVVAGDASPAPAAETVDQSHSASHIEAQHDHPHHP